jgi:hypothetical protein
MASLAASPTALPFQEEIGFDRQREAVENQYQVGLADNTFKVDDLALQRDVAQSRLDFRQRQQRQSLPGGFVRRGVLNSGLFNQALGDFATVSLDQQGELERNFLRRSNDLSIQLQGLNASRAIQLANIDLDEQSRRSAIASIIGAIG